MANPAAPPIRPSYPLGTPLDDMVLEPEFELYEQPFSRNHNRASMYGRMTSMATDSGDTAEALREFGGF